MQIIDGYCDVPNIYADDIGEYNISLFGAGDYVLSVGEKLGYELVSNNELRIKDGIFLTQGRRGIIKKGSSEICIIENGTQAEKRNDLVVIEYARDEATQVESHSLKVIKGTPGEEAADPEVITGDISSGAVIHQMPLYRVRLDGLNVVAVEPLFEIGNVSPETVDPMTATEEGFAADAKLTGDALRDLSAKSPFAFGVDADGNYGYIKEGADTVTPFKLSDFEIVLNWAIGYWDSKGYNNFSQSYKATKRGTLVVYAMASWWSNTPLGTPVSNCTLNGFSISPIKKNSYTPGIISIYKINVEKDDTIICSGTAFNVGPGDYYCWASVCMMYL